ncbi:MAG: HAD-IA family hydrolase [Patescibacteria group bacterium]|jgi:phosphoglycolate phosphatase
MAKTIIFDFDGTMANTLEAMIGIYNTLAPRYGCKVVDVADLERLRGSKPKDLMREFNVSAWKLPFLVSAVRRGLKTRMAIMPAQPGVCEAIRELHGKGVTLGILTSNSQENVETFLRTNNLENIFSFISSSRHLFGKHRALRNIMKTRHLLTSEVSYVGDEIRDVESAKKAGVTSVGVTWGFQTKGAIESARPNILINIPSELLELSK